MKKFVIGGLVLLLLAVWTIAGELYLDPGLASGELTVDNVPQGEVSLTTDTLGILGYVGTNWINTENAKILQAYFRVSAADSLDATTDTIVVQLKTSYRVGDDSLTRTIVTDTLDSLGYVWYTYDNDTLFWPYTYFYITIWDSIAGAGAWSSGYNFKAGYKIKK